uniref:Cytochrome c oxidase subunit 3 n=1 Tax=Babesia duncani TaxID=323732 RepID=A0A385GNF5_9APIC|nr:cytochrome c oxidase subunit III [Babesia duncani]AXX76191.1 cytochrome c oxidase subunit III [Babesia duncani]
MGIGEFFSSNLLILIDSIREIITTSTSVLYAIFTMFIVSEVLIFSSFIWGYLHSRWANPLTLIEVNIEPFLRITEYLNIASSFISVLLHRLNEDAGFEIDFLSECLVLISIEFISFQCDEYMLLASCINNDWSTLYFYILTGLHSLHVCFGFILLLILTFISDGNGTLKEDDFVCGFYWHFVELVWIVLTFLLFL